MKKPATLLAHASNYTLGTVLVTLAGLISFPILTRLLSVDDYGVMNLIATLLSLAVAVAKLGTQHAALRFYSEVRVTRGEEGLREYRATVLLGMGALGLATTLVWAALSQVLPQAWWNDPQVRPLLLLTSVLILVRVLDSALVNQLRAQERSGVLNLYYVVRRYFGLALLLAVLFFVARDLWGFYAATIVGELLATLALAVWLLRQQPVHLAHASPALLRSMIAFGLPMVGYEFASVLLSMGDRYLIQRLIGSHALGVYAAAYNLCDYLRVGLLTAMVAAAQPMYLRLWAEEGQAATAEFLRRFLHVYVMAAVFVIAGTTAIGRELLALLASAKYEAGSVIVPWTLAGMALETVIVIVGAGLYIEKRTRSVMLLIFAGVAVNVTLNLLLIPRLGIEGSAIATFAAYGTVALLCALAGRRTVSAGLAWAALVKFGAFGLLTYAAAMQLSGPAPWATLVLRVVVGTALYAGLVLAFDAPSRQWFAGQFGRLRERFRTTG